MTTKKKNSKGSIGRKLQVLSVTTLVLTVVAVSALFIMFERRLIVDNLHSKRTSTSTLGETVAGAVKFKKADKMDEAFVSFVEKSEGDAIWVGATDAEGNLIHEFGELGNRDEVISSYGTQADPEISWAQDLVYTAPVLYGPKSAEVGNILVAWSLDKTMTEANRSALVVIGVGAILVVFSSILSGIALRKLVSAPIEDINRTMEELSNERYDMPIPHGDRSDEIGQMSKVLDGFRRSLFDAQNAQQERQRAYEDAKRQRQEMLLRLSDGVGSVVEAAKLGEFDRRVPDLDQDDEFFEISNGINHLCENVSQFLEELDRCTEQLSQSDLTGRFAKAHNGRFGLVGDRFNSSMNTLTESISKLQQTSSEMGDSIKFVSGSSKEISEQAASQAVTLEETNAAMEVMNSSVKANNRRAKEMAEQTFEAQQRAHNGSEVVKKAVSAMEDIKASSTRITEITGVIDDIAFQTNLLALNAAVEAARAGEAGKGFAVVAAEVRTLAQRASESAQDIKGLILASQSKVSDGAALVNDTGDALSKIIESIELTASQIDEITSATDEQANGVNEIYATVSQLDQNTQKNAQNADSSAGASEDLAGQVQTLNDIVAVFRFSTTDRPGYVKPDLDEAAA